MTSPLENLCGKDKPLAEIDTLENARRLLAQHNGAV